MLLTPVLLVENTNNAEKCFLNSDIFALILIYLLFQQRPEGLLTSVTRQEPSDCGGVTLTTGRKFCIRTYFHQSYFLTFTLRPEGLNDNTHSEISERVQGHKADE